MADTDGKFGSIAAVSFRSTSIMVPKLGVKSSLATSRIGTAIEPPEARSIAALPENPVVRGSAGFSATPKVMKKSLSAKPVPGARPAVRAELDLGVHPRGRHGYRTGRASPPVRLRSSSNPFDLLTARPNSTSASMPSGIPPVARELHEPQRVQPQVELGGERLAGDQVQVRFEPGLRVGDDGLAGGQDEVDLHVVPVREQRARVGRREDVERLEVEQVVGAAGVDAGAERIEEDALDEVLDLRLVRQRLVRLLEPLADRRDVLVAELADGRAGHVEVVAHQGELRDEVARQALLDEAEERLDAPDDGHQVELHRGEVDGGQGERDIGEVSQVVEGPRVRVGA